jgi:hypothetical protein
LVRFLAIKLVFILSKEQNREEEKEASLFSAGAI